MQIFVVAKEEEGSTLLAFLKKHLIDAGSCAVSVKALKRAIDGKYCRVNREVETFSSHPLKKGDRVSLDPKGLEEISSQEKLSAPILFEDDSLLICNKPPGMVCDSQAVEKIFFPGLKLVHRLDKQTSGVLILAKSGVVLEKMITLFKEKKVKKLYLAIVDKKVKKKAGVITNYLGKKGGYQGQTLYGSVKGPPGLEAITRWQVLTRQDAATFLIAEPVTGRTHQLRVHFSEMGHPILGDHQYGKSFACPLDPKRHLLHAYSISFPHPVLDKKVEIKAPIPFDFQACLKALEINLGDASGSTF
ncbi:MAG: RluA family pseudouridine synthase [Chlamydiales bacterium]|nr:RluA family pseudouridine synthase [Chlamydiales bacterium]